MEISIPQGLEGKQIPDWGAGGHNRGNWEGLQVFHSIYVQYVSSENGAAQRTEFWFKDQQKELLI